MNLKHLLFILVIIAVAPIYVYGSQIQQTVPIDIIRYDDNNLPVAFKTGYGVHQDGIFQNWDFASGIDGWNFEIGGQVIGYYDSLGGLEHVLQLASCNPSETTNTWVGRSFRVPSLNPELTIGYGVNTLDVSGDFNEGVRDSGIKIVLITQSGENVLEDQILVSDPGKITMYEGIYSLSGLEGRMISVKVFGYGGGNARICPSCTGTCDQEFTLVDFIQVSGSEEVLPEVEMTFSAEVVGKGGNIDAYVTVGTRDTRKVASIQMELLLPAGWIIVETNASNLFFDPVTNVYTFTANGSFFFQLKVPVGSKEEVHTMEPSSIIAFDDQTFEEVPVDKVYLEVRGFPAGDLDENGVIEESDLSRLMDIYDGELSTEFLLNALARWSPLKR